MHLNAKPIGLHISHQSSCACACAWAISLLLKKLLLLLFHGIGSKNSVINCEEIMNKGRKYVGMDL